MEKAKAIIDTCFLEKVSSNGKNINSLYYIIDKMDYEPVVHPYVYKQEWILPYQTEIVESGYVKIVPYEDFIPGIIERKAYKAYFLQLYENLREYLDATGSRKTIERLDLRNDEEIFTRRSAKNSMGDIHMMLMAYFLQLPVILTEDSDIEILRYLADSLMKFGSYHLKIYKALNLVMKIAEKPDSKINKKDLRDILKAIGERKHNSELTAAWKKGHPDSE